MKAEHPLYQLLGVRYVIAPAGRGAPPAGAAVRRDSGARIFERAKALPRLFLPRSTEPPGILPWTEWLAMNTDFAARALVFPSAGRSTPWTAARPEDSVMEITIEPAQIAARALLAEERLSPQCLSGRSSDPAARRPAHTAVEANGPFVAAWLPAGEHRLDLVYRAQGLVPGLALAALALSGLVLGLIPTRLKRIKERGGHGPPRSSIQIQGPLTVLQRPARSSAAERTRRSQSASTCSRVVRMLPIAIRGVSAPVQGRRREEERARGVHPGQKPLVEAVRSRAAGRGSRRC